jgi:hypothetical protein
LGSAWLESADAIMATVPIANGRISLLASSLSRFFTSVLRDFSSDGFLSFIFLEQLLASLLARFDDDLDVKNSKNDDLFLLFAMASGVMLFLCSKAKPVRAFFCVLWTSRRTDVFVELSLDV